MMEQIAENKSSYEGKNPYKGRNSFFYIKNLIHCLILIKGLGTDLLRSQFLLGNNIL